MDLEERMAIVEGIMEEVRERLNHLQDDQSETRSQIRDLRNEMRSQFKWIIGILLCTILPMWVSVFLAILLKG